MTDAREDFDYEAALRACARGDQYALRALFERERRWLMAVALRITRRREVAEEVLQDAFLQIWAKPARSTRRSARHAAGSTPWCATARST